MTPRTTNATTVALLAVLLALSSGCSRNDAPQPLEAQFGLYFGSQIQQRTELPLELDESKQQQGFRVRFPKPTTRPTRISWELDCPTARTGSRGPGNAPRAQRKSQAELPVGADRFEQKLIFSTKDPPGTYNLRVRVDDRLVLDRPFRLVPTRTVSRP